MKKTLKISKEMKITDIVKKYPKTVFVFLSLGMHCISCPMANQDNSETIEQAAKAHGIDLKTLLKELNKAIK